MAPFAVDSPGGPREFFDCVVNVIPESLRGYLRAFVHHKAGNPWHSGGVGSWPWRYIRAMEIIGAEVNEIEAANREREKAIRSTPAGRALRGPVRSAV